VDKEGAMEIVEMMVNSISVKALSKVLERSFAKNSKQNL
jgi:hypothetical protein